MKIGINGFGRMGRLVARVLIEQFPHLEIVWINEVAVADDPSPAAALAHLFEFDSAHGQWQKQGHEPWQAARRELIINEKTAQVYTDKAFGFLEEAEYVSLVLDCTGAHKTKEALQPYFQSGIEKVVCACPVKGADATIVYGINDHIYDAAEHKIISAASCTTNCLAPVIKVLHEKIGIDHGLMTAIHASTNTQHVHDAFHKDWRRARAQGTSLIPTTTGSAKAIAAIYPELEGRLNGTAVRVPLQNASLLDLVVELKQDVTVEYVNELFREASETYLKNILGYEERPLVSVDFLNDQRSSIVDANSTMCIQGRGLKVLAWYDNEIGYVQRMAELTDTVAHSFG